MRTITFETQSFPARGGLRRGLSLNGVVPGGDPTEALFFGVANLVDPKTGRIEDAEFVVEVFHDDGSVEHFNLSASWTIDTATQHYGDLAFAGGGVVGGTVEGSESVSADGRVKTMQIVVTLP